MPLIQLVSREEERALLNVFGVAVEVLAGVESTGGAASVYRLTCPPGAGAPFHRHEVETEMFYLVSGELELRLGEQTLRLKAGDFALAGVGVPHAFRNVGTQDARALCVSTPGGHDRFFQDADALAASGRFTPATAAEVCTRHRIELLR